MGRWNWGMPFWKKRTPMPRDNSWPFPKNTTDGLLVYLVPEGKIPRANGMRDLWAPGAASGRSGGVFYSYPYGKKELS